MQRRFLSLIVHGERADRPDVRHLVRWVRRRGHSVEVLPTWERGDGTWLAAAAADRGADAVIAVGGDGTLNEVVNGLDGHDTSLGVIPAGTANDFARQLGIPMDLDHAMDVVLQRPSIRMDTASLNGRRFVNVSSGGIGAETTAETPAAAKARFGAFAYAITGLRKLAELPSYRASFRADELRLDTEFLVFAVGNARTTGAGTLLAPHASVTDGYLDVTIVEARQRREAARLFLKVKRGEHVATPGVHYARVKSLRITSLDAISVNVDGEAMKLARMEYRVRAGDLRVHAKHPPGEEAGPEGMR